MHERATNEVIYQEAIEEIRAGEYRDAIDKLETLRYFKETRNYIKYADALLRLSDENEGEALDILRSLGDFENSAEKADELMKHGQQED